jgi:predicted ABC-type sugar transport system permease subunit
MGLYPSPRSHHGRVVLEWGVSWPIRRDKEGAPSSSRLFGSRKGMGVVPIPSFLSLYSWTTGTRGRTYVVISNIHVLENKNVHFLGDGYDTQTPTLVLLISIVSIVVVGRMVTWAQRTMTPSSSSLPITQERSRLAHIGCRGLCNIVVVVLFVVMQSCWRQ